MKKTLPEYVLYNGEVVLTFEAKTHTYFLDEMEVPSTTSITKVVAKDMLMFWAVNETISFLKKQWIKGRTYTKEQIDAILNRSKYAHKRTGETATDIGTEVHNWIEEFILEVMETGNPQPKKTLPKRPSSRKSVKAFLAWYEANEVEFIAAEKKVYSRNKNYSGTYDLKARVNGVLSIVDFKTSKSIYPDYYIQGAAYWLADEEEQTHVHGEGNFEQVQQFIVLRVPKDGKSFQEGVIDDPAPYIKIFDACLAIYNWVNGKGHWPDVPKPKKDNNDD